MTHTSNGTNRSIGRYQGAESLFRCIHFITNYNPNLVEFPTNLLSITPSFPIVTPFLMTRTSELIRLQVQAYDNRFGSATGPDDRGIEVVWLETGVFFSGSRLGVGS